MFLTIRSFESARINVTGKVVGNAMGITYTPVDDLEVYVDHHYDYGTDTREDIHEY